jgi:hypothetical protein
MSDAKACGSAPIWPKAETHAESLLSDLRRAFKKGQGKKADYLQRCYLASFDARLVAVQAAFHAMRPWRRPPKSKLPEVARNLNAWRGTKERVVIKFKLKASNPHPLFRPIMDFGIENRALQYLVEACVMAQVDLHPTQFATTGGRDAAIKFVRDALVSGYRHVAEVDIRDCYLSFDGEKLSTLLPVPKEVISKVILSNDLNLYSDNKLIRLCCISPEIDEGCGGNIAEARQGIPQGSAVSNAVAEILLAPVLTQVPNYGIVLTYADNILLMAKQAKEAVSMRKALYSALKTHPAGPLLPNNPKIYKPGQAIDFLGYTLRLDGGEYRIDPSAKNYSKFKARFAKKLKGVSADGIPIRVRRARLADLRAYVSSWSSAFALWEAAAQHRAKYLAYVTEAASSLGIG